MAAIATAYHAACLGFERARPIFWGTFRGLYSGLVSQPTNRTHVRTCGTDEVDFLLSPSISCIGLIARNVGD